MTMKRIQLEVGDDTHDFTGADLRALIIAAEDVFRQHYRKAIAIKTGGIGPADIQKLIAYLAGVAAEENAVWQMEMKPWRN